MFKQRHEDSFVLEKGVTGGGEALSQLIAELIKVRSVYMRVLVEGVK